MMAKRIICGILTLVLISTVLGARFVYVIHSEYQSDFRSEIYMYGWDSTLSEYPIHEYLSKAPSWYSPHQGAYPAVYNSPPTLSDLVGHLFGFTCPYYVEYKSSNVNVLAKTTVYKFSVRERICFCGDCFENAKNIRMSFKFDLLKNNRVFYSEAECTLALHGKGFEAGKEYVIFPDEGRFDRFDRFVFNKCEVLPRNFAIGYLDEEYPYIEFYPSLMRCDATFFGAETPYVSKEEFVRYIKDNCYREPDPDPDRSIVYCK